MSYALLAHWAVNMIWYLLRSVSTYNISVLFLFQLYSVCTNVESFVGLHAHDPTMGSSSIFVRAGPHTRIACEGREREKGDGGEKRDGGNGTCFGGCRRRGRESWRRGWGSPTRLAHCRRGPCNRRKHPRPSTASVATDAPHKMLSSSTPSSLSVATLAIPDN